MTWLGKTIGTFGTLGLLMVGAASISAPANAACSCSCEDGVINATCDSPKEGPPICPTEVCAPAQRYLQTTDAQYEPVHKTNACENESGSDSDAQQGVWLTQCGKKNLR
ncbi:MAG: hypothetical protein ACPG06_06230 [Alphaproteobacteria bacterium]